MLSQKSISACIVTLALLTGCKPTQFQASERPASIMNIGFPVSCEQEKSKTIKLSKSDTNILSFPKNCMIEGKSDKKPADIVFVIDITASMEDSLNTVKNGVERFATRLRQEKGWDARFAAVGYRDQVAQVVPFSDEKTLASTVKSWIADGGNDLQEGGQSGLQAAVQLITQDAAANAARSNASKVILYIADAISFALNGNHKDFSTGELERVFETIPSSLKSQLKFFHSTAQQVEACSLPTIFGCARTALSEELAARGQINALAQKIGLPGKGFEFPFTESIMLSEFMDEFTPDQSCKFNSAIALDAQGKELAKAEESGSLRLPRSAAGKPLQVQVERCCSGSPSASGSSCSPSKNTVSFTF